MLEYENREEDLSALRGPQQDSVRRLENDIRNYFKGLVLENIDKISNDGLGKIVLIAFGFDNNEMIEQIKAHVDKAIVNSGVAVQEDVRTVRRAFCMNPEE